jgi:hypothetical protein
MQIRLFRGAPGAPGLFGRGGFKGGRKWGPPRFGKRLGRPPVPGGGVPPMLDEFSPGGPWAEFGPGSEGFGPSGPWVEGIWEGPPGPYGPGPWFGPFDEDF